MTVARSYGARRALALLAAFCLLGPLMFVVFSTPVLGDSSPSAECASTDPAWNGDFWKAEEDDGVLGDIETNIAGAITLSASGSWTNNNEDPVFRVVLKIDEDDDDDVQVLSGMWETGEGGTIATPLDELDHVTFCATSEVAAEPEPTTTTLSSTTTTTAPATTTTSPGATTTTSPGPTTTTSPGPTTTTSPGPTTTTDPAASPVSTPEGSTTTSPSDNATTTPAEAGASGLASEASQADEDASQADEAVDQVDGTEPDDDDSPPGTDGNTTAAGPSDGGPGDPTALGQEAPDAGPGLFQSPHKWTLADLAILGGLIAALAALVARRRLRRLFWDLGERWR